LVAFLRLFRDLPSIDEILLNPDKAPLPAEPSAQIAIATALGRILTDHSIAKGMQYLDRMPTEMRVLAIRDAAAQNRGITHTPEFVRFGVECTRHFSITRVAETAIGNAGIWHATMPLTLYSWMPGSRCQRMFSSTIAFAA